MDDTAAIQRLREAVGGWLDPIATVSVRTLDITALLDAHAALVERVRVLETVIQTAIPEYEYLMQMLEAHAPYELVGGEEEALDGLRAAAAPQPAAQPEDE